MDGGSQPSNVSGGQVSPDGVDEESWASSPPNGWVQFAVMADDGTISMRTADLYGPRGWHAEALRAVSEACEKLTALRAQEDVASSRLAELRRLSIENMRP